MTIACCYVSPEGVVFGADSTVSYRLADGMHYLNHAQKVFQIGEESTVGIVFWGLAGLGPLSFRTLVAKLHDGFAAAPPATVEEVMNRWVTLFHPLYEAAIVADPDLKVVIENCRTLAAKTPYVEGGPAGAGIRTKEEEETFLSVRQQFTTGFAVGGHILPDRTPTARYVHFEPHVATAPVPVEVPMGSYGFWGAPNIFQRLVLGADEATKASILASDKWVGTMEELNAVIAPHKLEHPPMPLREVIDFVHTCIHGTIKALKFSHFSQVCGGPIELAMVSSDRKFRWVRHKEWDAAVVDGDIS